MKERDGQIESGKHTERDERWKRIQSAFFSELDWCNVTIAEDKRNIFYYRMCAHPH